MKNVFKFLGIALLASSLVLVSCGKEEENNNNNGTENNGGNNNGDNNGGNNGGNNTTESATVTFSGDTWTAEGIQSKYYADYQVVTATLGGDAAFANFPLVEFAIYRDAAGTYTDNFDIANQAWGNDIYAWVEYYEETYISDGQTAYGDWWASSATTNITAIDLTAGKVSATCNANMFSAVEAFVDGSDSPAETTMSFTLTNVTIAPAK
ncbi:MAG: hypothetical protein MJZ81_02650 [Bacteroidales bacterium]|nr:hypothetical protein [Bacteroidales bacterium]